MSLVLSADLLQQIWSHGEASYPEEGAGLILGLEQGEMRKAHAIRAVLNRREGEARRRRYEIDPRDMLGAEDEADRLGLAIIGVFHSHPDHPASPSETDYRFAVPWYSYLITSVPLGKAMESRSWRLDESEERMIEERLIIQPGSEA